MTHIQAWVCVYTWKHGLCTLAVHTEKFKQNQESTKKYKHGQRGWYCIMLNAWSSSSKARFVSLVSSH